MEIKKLQESIVDLEGGAIYYKKQPLSFGKCISLIMATDRSSEVSNKRCYELCQQLYVKDEVELTSKEYEQIKKLFSEAKGFPPYVMGQTYKFLEEAGDA